MASVEKLRFILLVTGDLTEAPALSDRMAVFFEGRVMDTFDSDDQQKLAQIGLPMAGVDDSPDITPQADR